MLACLKRLVIFLIFGLWYVKIAHFCFSFLLCLISGGFSCVVFALLGSLRVFLESCCFVQLTVVTSILFIVFRSLLVAKAFW